MEPPWVGGVYNDFPAALRKVGLEHRWIFNRGHRPTFIACPHCGFALCAPMHFRKVANYLCLSPDCRLDEAGVRWPTRFDQYIREPQKWLDAGVKLDLPGGALVDGAIQATSMAGNFVTPVVRSRRHATEVSEETAASILTMYADRSERVTDIAAKLGVSVGTVYKTVRQADAPLRSAPPLAG